jgi:RNase adaptor protein for sRNA GlmZ degradation
MQQRTPVHARIERLSGGEVPRLRFGKPVETVVIYLVMHMEDYIPYLSDNLPNRLCERPAADTVVSEMLGHASIAITLDTYSHVLPNMQDSAARALEEALR